MGRVGIASVLLLALVSGARAEISEDEARTIIEQTMGVSLEGVPGEPDLDPRRVIFHVGTSGAYYCANLELGQFSGYRRAYPPVEYAQDGTLLTPFTVTEDQARETALAELRRYMGPAYAKITEWRGHRTESGGFDLDGCGPPVGDPPHHGLSPAGGATVSLVTGEVIHYRQFIPVAAEPVAPRITQEEAIRKALEHWGIPEASGEHLAGKQLILMQDSYGKGELTWYVPLAARITRKERDADGNEITIIDQLSRNYDIDALTGEVRKFDQSL